MNPDAKQKLRAYLADALKKHGDSGAYLDEEPLFTSGRLDSFSMMNLVMFLEEAFGLDFSDFEFDVNLVDSVLEIEALVDSQGAG